MPSSNRRKCPELRVSNCAQRATDAKGRSQTNLAKTSGYRQSFSCNIETGRQTPRIAFFDLLMALNVEPEMFMSSLLKRVTGRKFQSRCVFDASLYAKVDKHPDSHGRLPQMKRMWINEYGS